MKPTNCMNDKCADLIGCSNHPGMEVSTWWYECALDIEDAKDCKEGISISEFKEVKLNAKRIK